MKLSHLQNPRREGLCSHGNEEEPWYQLPQIEAPVEPITKFCQIPREMLLADCMECPSQRVLHIADNGIEPLEFRDLDTVRATAGDDCGMVIPGSADCLETAKAIGNNLSPRSYMLGSPGVNSFQGE